MRRTMVPKRVIGSKHVYSSVEVVTTVEMVSNACEYDACMFRGWVSTEYYVWVNMEEH